MAKVLVTEDSGFSRRMICKMLRDLGHEPVEAEGGARGLELIASGAFDLMFLDLLMPAPDGLEVLRLLKERGNRVPVVVCSADVQETSRQMVAALGALGFLRKPPKPAEIREWVDKALEAGARRSP